MGLDLTLRMADWERLRAIPVDHRIPALDDTFWPTDADDAYAIAYGSANGWVWPPHQRPAWCAEYHFHNTTGSYKPHAHAGDAWADIRTLVDRPAREAMDGFLNGLIWDEDPAADPALTGGGGLHMGE